MKKNKTKVFNESKHSMFREKMLEHIFISELLQQAWLSRKPDFEILHSEVDGSGYDLVITFEGEVHHIQFKGTRKDAKTSKFQLNEKLLVKSNPSILLLVFEEKLDKIDTKFYLLPLHKRSTNGLKPAQNRRYKDKSKTRKGIFYIPKSKITKSNIRTIEEIMDYIIK